MAHRCIEWDGWEEGLIGSILGPEEQENDWFTRWEDDKCGEDSPDRPESPPLEDSPGSSTSPTLFDSGSEQSNEGSKKSPVVPVTVASAPVLGALAANGGAKPLGRAAVPLVAKVVAVEKEKEKLLNATGDFCGGRGGELGMRLGAWLTLNGDAEGRVELPKKWREHEHDDEIKAVPRALSE